MAMTTMAVRSARNGKVVLSSWLINKSNNNKKSAIFWRAASSSSIPKIDGDKDKKIREEERLSAVIDAVNDRKLPPELRGQRNSVRSVPSCSLLPAFIICNTNNSCSLLLLLLLFGCRKIKSVVLSSFIKVLRFCITTTTAFYFVLHSMLHQRIVPCHGDAGGAWG